MDYSDISDIVEYLVRAKSYNYTFDCYTPEDIGQEIRLICFKVLEHFDWNKVPFDLERMTDIDVNKKLTNFFGTCVDNALKNLKRDKYVRRMAPCGEECELLHGEHPDLQRVCKRWLKWQKKIAIRLSIKHPVSFDVIGDVVEDKIGSSQVDVSDTTSYLIKNIAPELRLDLIKMLNGDRKEVEYTRQKKIRLAVRNMLDKQV